jgi:hypothetical protein
LPFRAPHHVNNAHAGYELDELSLIPSFAKQEFKVGGNPSHSRSHGVRARGVEARCEFDVWSFLGLRYLPPAERNCYSFHAEAGGVKQGGRRGSRDSGDADEAM